MLKKRRKRERKKIMTTKKVKKRDIQIRRKRNRKLVRLL